MKKVIPLNPKAVVIAVVSAEFEYLRRPEAGPNEVLFQPLRMADQIRPQDILSHLGGELPVANSKRCVFGVPPAAELERLSTRAFLDAKNRRYHILTGQSNGLTPTEANLMIEAVNRIHNILKVARSSGSN